LVLATLQGADVILCQITSQARSDIYSIALDSADFTNGGLNQSSKIRPKPVVHGRWRTHRLPCRPHIGR